MKYIMRKIKFEHGVGISIPEGSLCIQIVRDPQWDAHVLMYLEQVPVRGECVCD